MRLTTRQTGIISYAGLDGDALWAAAKRVFAQSDSPVPERFRAFLPIFPVELVQNMSYVGRAPGHLSKVSPEGFSTDPDEYHRQLCADLPDLYTGDNRLRCFDAEGRFRSGCAVAVDRAWATLFPQYQPFLGERLVVYMIGGGHQAVAVPESIFPRGGGVLQDAERELRITARCTHYLAYLKARLAMGEGYDPTRFEEDYLRLNALASVCVRQKELGRVMQDLSIIRGLGGSSPEGEGLYTLNAKRAEGVRQYVPWRYACDTFEASPITRGTARLMQLCFADGGAPGDFWLPFQDACEYIDRQRMTLDVRALCEGFQIAPAYDPATHGGRYPTQVRVAAVRDRALRPLMADALNNPAYGSGMSPLGMLNKLVFLPDSRELLRQGRLELENFSVRCENAAVGEDTYRHMRAMARWQEWKGRLIDAMYRRESALSQMQVGTRAYDRADELLTHRVNVAEREVELAAMALPEGQLSGYDADIDYLRRMHRFREGVPEDEAPPMLFAPDALRELCIESGYAMRSAVHSFALRQLEDAAQQEAESASEALREPEALPDAPAPAENSSDESAPPPPAESAAPAAPARDETAPAASPAGKRKPKTAARPVKRKKGVQHASPPRFEQIDMFSAPISQPAQVQQPEPGSPPSPEPAPIKTEDSPRYIPRSLSQLMGKAAGPAAPGKMARLLSEQKHSNNPSDGRD